MTNQLGFIGLGRMGGRMVATLARAGQPAIVYDASAEALERATRLDGISGAPTPAGVAAGSDVLFTALPNDSIVREVYLGENGIASGARAGLITCDCSTVSPDLSAQLHGELAQQGIHHMTTPMLGSTPQAESGDIFFIVGGEKERLPAIVPYLEIMGKMHQHVGPPDAANKIKLMHNALGAINAVAVSEILAMGIKAGVNIEDFYNVVCNGGGQAYSTYFNSRVMRMAAGNFEPTFTVELMNKDVNMALELAEGLGGPVAIMKATQEAYNQVADNSAWVHEDFSAVTHLAERKIGRTISGK